MKNRNLLNVGIAVVVGLILGYLIFGSSSETKPEPDHDHDAEMASGQMWTCSMHPQIMQPEPGSCPICGMDLIPADSTGEGLTQNQIKMTDNAIALAGVETVVIGSGATDTDQVKLSGKVAVNQESDAVQSAYFDGRIEKLNINFEGEEVRKGQKLATIYSPQLVSAQQELLTASGLKSSQPQLYLAVRNKLKLWKLSDSQIDKIESSGQVVENFPVYANVSGVVSSIMVEEGDYVKTGMPLVKVANLNSVWAIFDAYESQLSLFKKGQSMEVTTNAYPNETFGATISFVDPLLNNATRTVKVRAELDNKKGLLKPGMFVQGKIDVANKSAMEMLTVPESAVLWTGKRSVVYVKPNPTESVFELREVELGNLMEGNYQVHSGLNSGEEVVAKGTFTVDAAAQLQGKKSMMNPKGEMSMTGHEGHGAMGMKMDFSKAAQQTFDGLLDNYLQLKDALVASDQQKVRQLAETGTKQARELTSKEMDAMGRSHVLKIEEQFGAMANGATIETQREAFVALSENMILVGSQMKGMDKKLYVQHCPMADNNKGANWLSLEKEIRNPYYGDAMLTCGSVVSTIN
ncbi:efflux RND transporter periplasmic adaptor subunit [Flagellimonas aequoris]|uniref:Efflux RND transporter periplasmic adaptor subunit n=1 Tax=Flagellimonas aequoris TaxID=2306997 RepID=A0A418N8M9_9FLAO|nr:efflux RND transporter periplasmic adaptor subunit [Allomuricauda aequoris]RIV70891.1 efflux RND transporter periplasmic adaptor subunit [Allomuricauda aequoris]TXK01980.1 efflux RND transporter periplasmic adaptor subunit [Allomuricauda aequoris]